jgi:hypothetical protein
MSHSCTDGVRRKQPLTTDTLFLLHAYHRVPSASSTISPILTVRLQGFLNWSSFLTCQWSSPEKPCCSPLESKDVDGKHEIYHFVANILEKICEWLHQDTITSSLVIQNSVLQPSLDVVPMYGPNSSPCAFLELTSWCIYIVNYTKTHYSIFLSILDHNKL